MPGKESSVMNILVIDAYPQLVRALRELGHTVHDLYGFAEFFSLSDYMEESGFKPDLLFQQEHLVRRSFIRGLDTAPFPTVFWPLDTHINMYWQQWYSLLFDVVLTPHVSLFDLLPKECRPPSTNRFAWYGEPRPFRPFAERIHDLGFCGRLCPVNRPIRTWMLELLERQNLKVVDGIPQEEMFRFFDDVRCVPNETLAHETNFRILEAGSSGCLILSPDIGEDQNALLEPGKELLVYHDALELLDQTAWAKAHPEAAEKIGRAALERISAEHTPLHRAQTLLDLASRAAPNRLSGPPARLCFWITLAWRLRNTKRDNDYSTHAEKGLALLNALPAWQELDAVTRTLVAHSYAQIIYLYGEDRKNSAASEQGIRLCNELLSQSIPGSPSPAQTGRPGDIQTASAPVKTLEVALAASFLALKNNNFQQAQFFYVQMMNGRVPHLPETPFELCLAWVEAQTFESTIAQRGFLFSPDEGLLPSSALGCLLNARFLEPHNNSVRWFTLFSALTAQHPSLSPLRLGCLAKRSMLEPDNWHAQQEYGLVCLKTCRVDQGLFELRSALEKAVKHGRERLFMQRLKAASTGIEHRNWAAVLAEATA